MANHKQMVICGLLVAVGLLFIVGLLPGWMLASVWISETPAVHREFPIDPRE